MWKFESVHFIPVNIGCVKYWDAVRETDIVRVKVSPLLSTSYNISNKMYDMLRVAEKWVIYYAGEKFARWVFRRLVW